MAGGSERPELGRLGMTGGLPLNRKVPTRICRCGTDAGMAVPATTGHFPSFKRPSGLEGGYSSGHLSCFGNCDFS